MILVGVEREFDSELKETVAHVVLRLDGKDGVAGAVYMDWSDTRTLINLLRAVLCNLECKEQPDAP